MCKLLYMPQLIFLSSSNIKQLWTNICRNILLCEILKSQKILEFGQGCPNFCIQLNAAVYSYSVSTLGNTAAPTQYVFILAPLCGKIRLIKFHYPYSAFDENPTGIYIPEPSRSTMHVWLNKQLFQFHNKNTNLQTCSSIPHGHHFASLPHSPHYVRKTLRYTA